MRTCVIINPVAGSAVDLPQLAGKLADLPGVRVLLTTKAGDAFRLAREAAEQGFDRIVAAGGDGTINDCLNGIADHLDRVEFGILPLGTGNDFTASINMRIPPEEAIAHLVRWDARAVDVVRVRAIGPEGPVDRLMLNGSSGGFVEAVGAATDQDSKRGILGSLSYVLTAALSASTMQIYDLAIRASGGPESPRRLRAVATVVSNGRSIGGGVPVCPEACIDDGRLDIMIIPEMPLAELALLGMSIVAGNHRDDPGLLFMTAERLTIETDPPMPVSVDGESLGASPVTYEVLPRALRVAVGPDPPALSPPGTFTPRGA